MRVATARYRPGHGWLEPLSGEDSPATLVLAFADPEVSAEDPIWGELRDRFPQSVRCGCSTSGQFDGPVICDREVVVTVAQFHRTRLASASAAVAGGPDSRRAGEEIGERLTAPDLRGVLVLSDGLAVNGSELAAGLLSRLAQDVVVTGGLAGDGSRFGHTWLLDHDLVTSHRVVAVGLYGDAVTIGAGSCGGWSGFGPPREVTGAVGNVLHELDGEPALDLYRRYLGDLAGELPATGLLMPLAVRSAAGGETVVRTLLAIDEDHRSMTFAGDIPAGGVAQLMRADREDLIDGAATAAERSLVGQDGEGPGLALAVSCVGRRLVLGDRADEELDSAREQLPGRFSLTGFYSYGELAPGLAGRCELHNQTMTITTISER